MLPVQRSHFSRDIEHLGLRMKHLCRCCCSRRWIHWSHIQMVSSSHSLRGVPKTVGIPLIAIAIVGRALMLIAFTSYSKSRCAATVHDGYAASMSLASNRIDGCDRHPL